MDMDESWNPEPPPEIMKINKEDLIGDTLFSKHWLFEVLLKLIKVCDSIIAKNLIILFKLRFKSTFIS